MTEKITFYDFVKNNYKIIAIVFAVLLLSFFVLFGVAGIKTFAGIIILFFLPFFLILYNLPLDIGEKVFFSLFIGMVAFSQILWYVDRIMHNIYLSIIITGLLLYGIGIYLSVVKLRKKQTSTSEQS